VGGPKETPEVIEEREKLAQKLKDFMKNNLFTEKKLADVVGASRRTIQMIKAAAATPHESTLEKLEKLFLKYRREGK
jgi:transcriptional regulator with XRE-family HTH domain